MRKELTSLSDKMHGWNFVEDGSQKKNYVQK
jgi:hypothetical protein